MTVPERFKVGITRYQPADAADLAEFQLHTFGAGSRQLDVARAAWLFDQNPWRTDDATRDLWVCRRKGTIVGQQAEIPFVLKVGEREHRAAWAIDLMVDDAWRLRGVGPALVATQLEGHTIVAGLNLSDKGHANHTRAGWTDLGVIPVYLRPLHLGRAARLGSVPSGVARVAPVAGPAARAADATAVAALRAAGARLEPIGRFDERVDEVWRSAAGHYPVLARRDLVALRWRIDQRPDAAALHRYYLVAHHRTVGYVALRTGGTAEAPTAVVVDYLAAPRWVAPLLLAASRVARRQGAVAMSVKTRNRQADRSLRATGFLRRDHGSDDPIRAVVLCTDDEVRPLVTDPDRWFVTSADSDLEYAMTPAARPPAGRDAPGTERDTGHDPVPTAEAP